VQDTTSNNNIPIPTNQHDAMDIEEFICIDRLEELGINKLDLKKVKESGLHTVESLLMETKKGLSNIKGLSDAKVDKILEAAKKTSSVGQFSTGKEMQLRREAEIVHISTGSTAFDDLLGGGFETKALTEIYGEFRCGKTQLCHTLCVTAQAVGERGGKVIYLDCEGTFRPDRIKPISERFGLDADSVLENITHARLPTFESQLEILVDAAALMVESGPYRLMIIDSISCNMRTDYSGRGELAERQQKLGIMLSRLRKLAESLNISIVYTNQVMSDPSGGLTFVSDPKKAVGGHVMAHASTIRISIRKGKAEQRLAKIVQAPNLAENEVSFAISNDGIVDYKD
jgi:meiotic recombination protein DMC1